jgi:uncharacterized protein (TIGR02271 family)
VTRDDDALVRHDEVLRTGTETVETGRLHIRKRVEEERVQERVELGREDADVERHAVDGPDSGEIETLPDGSISVPLFVEELVIEKRLVVRERIIIRKRTELEEHVVEADLRRERLDLDADDGVEVRGDPLDR